MTDLVERQLTTLVDAKTGDFMGFRGADGTIDMVIAGFAGFISVGLTPAAHTDLVTARANSTAIQNALNSATGGNTIVYLYATGAGAVYLAPTAIATLNASGSTTPYAFSIPSDVTIQCADELVIGKAYSDGNNTSINSMGLFGINSLHNSVSVVISGATHALGFSLGTGNEGFPRLVTFTLASAPVLAAGDSFQVIGELSNSGYNEEHWVAASVSGATVTAYTNMAVGTFSGNSYTKLIPSNRGITIRGGKWDGGSLYNHMGGSAVYGCGFLFNKVNDLFLDNVTLQNGPQYAVMYCNLRSMRVHNYTNDGYAAGLWGAAPFFNIDVDGFQSTSVDDSFATVGDHDNGYSSSYAYGDITIWDMATSDNPLPRRGITIRNGRLHGHGRLAIYAGPGELSGIVLDNIITESPITFSGIASVSGFDTWLPNTLYALNDKKKLNNKIYNVIAPGTSAASGGPSGRGNSIVDGTVTWAYHSSLSPNNIINDLTLRNIKFVTRKGWTSTTGSDPAVGTSAFISPNNGSENMTISSLSLENITVDNSLVCNFALLTAASGLTIENLSIKNLKYKNATAYSVITCNAAGDGLTTALTAAKISNMSIDSGSVVMDLASMTNNIGMFASAQSGGNWKFSNLSLSSINSGAFTLAFASSSLGVIDRVEFNNCAITTAAQGTLTGGAIRQTVVNGGVMTVSSAAGTDRGFLLGATNGDYIFNGVVSNALVDGMWHSSTANLNSVIYNACSMDFKSATTSYGIAFVLYNGTTVALLEMNGCNFNSSDNSAGTYSVVSSIGTGSFGQFNVTGGSLKNGGRLFNNGPDNSSVSVSGLYVVNAKSLVSHGGHMNIRIDNVNVSGSLGDGGLLSTWGNLKTWKVSSSGCNTGTNPLGVNGTNNALNLAVYGWMGSGAYATWGGTPTVTALGKY